MEKAKTGDLFAKPPPASFPALMRAEIGLM